MGSTKLKLILLCTCILFLIAGCSDRTVDSLTDTMTDNIEKYVEEKADQVMDADIFHVGSKTKKIEFWNMTGEIALVKSLTDENQIEMFIEDLDTDEELEIDSLPTDATPLYRLDYYQESTKQVLKQETQLQLVSQETLYVDANKNYYLHTSIPDSGLPDTFDEYLEFTAKMADEDAEYILKIIKD